MSYQTIAAPIGTATIESHSHPFHGYNIHEVNEPAHLRDHKTDKFLTHTRIKNPTKIGIMRPNRSVFSFPTQTSQHPVTGMQLPRQFAYTRALLSTRRNIISNKYTHKGARDQGECGSCYAFAIAEMITDRVAVRTRGKFHDEIAPRSLICQSGEGIQGCGGGEPYIALRTVKSKGMAREDDMPYLDGSTICSDVSNRVYVDEIRAITDTSSTNLGNLRDFAEKKRKLPDEVHRKNIQSMMEELIREGPFVVGMVVYSDFTQYTGGVYSRHEDAVFQGLHAVELVGYDQGDPNDPNDIPHWIVRNSWGEKFGKRGFFCIRMGTNEAAIETYAVSAKPQFGKGILANYKDEGVQGNEGLKPTDIDGDGDIDIGNDDDYDDTDGGKQRRDKIIRNVAIMIMGAAIVAVVVKAFTKYQPSSSHHHSSRYDLYDLS